MITYDCCEYGDGVTEDECGQGIYPDLCDCDCHVEEDWLDYAI